MKKTMSVKQFFNRLNQLDFSSDSTGATEKLFGLIHAAIAGHNSSCPHDEDQDCSECDCQDSETVQEVIVRVSRKSHQICCVEWPLIPAEGTSIEKNSRGETFRKGIRGQIRVAKDQGITTRIILDWRPPCNNNLKNALRDIRSIRL